MSQAPAAQWTGAEAYERFMGRWSRIAGREFLKWLSVPADRRWLDVGCGTGAFSEVILEACNPKEFVGVDTSEELLAEARSRFSDRPVTFLVGDALALPFAKGCFDVAVSGLVLNFVSDPARMVAEMERVVALGGCVAAYVWDFAGGTSVSQHLAKALVKHCAPNEEFCAHARQSGVTELDRLSKTFNEAGLERVEVRQIEISLNFENFEDYWSANTTFPSPPARQLARLASEDREIIKRDVLEMLAPRTDGTIAYSALANAVRGIVASPSKVHTNYPGFYPKYDMALIVKR